MKRLYLVGYTNAVNSYEHEVMADSEREAETQAKADLGEITIDYVEPYTGMPL